MGIVLDPVHLLVVVYLVDISFSDTNNGIVMELHTYFMKLKGIID